MILEAGNLGALLSGGALDESADGLARGFDGALGYRREFCSVMPDQTARARRVRAEVVVDLIHFAAEAEHDGGGDVRVVEHARQCALELRGVGTDRHAAALAVRKATTPSTLGGSVSSS